jgi:hypothetical protein
MNNTKKHLKHILLLTTNEILESDSTINSKIKKKNPIH